MHVEGIWTSVCTKFKVWSRERIEFIGRSGDREREFGGDGKIMEK
jgi:hypothetical protein